MISIRSILIALYLVPAATAFGLSDGRVLVEGLNVRSNPDGERIDQLAVDRKVQVIKDDSGWSQIIYVDDSSGKASYGWVSSQFIELEFEAASVDCSEHPTDQQQFCLTIDDPNMQCSIYERTNIYKRCVVDLSYELSAENESQDDMDGVTISCDASLRAKDNRSDVSSSISKTAARTYDAQTLDETVERIEIIFEFDLEAETSLVQLQGATCEILFNQDIARETSGI